MQVTRLTLVCVGVLVLVLAALPLPASGPITSGGLAVPAPGRAPSVPTGSGWSPASHRPSPGIGPYHLTTRPRQGSSCALTSGPGWLAYDSADQSLWVATPPDCVDIISNGLSNVSQVAVGSDPFGVAVDAAAHEVFVTNTGSDNVTVLNDTSQATVASIPVGSSPLGIAYDNATDQLYVADSGASELSVISVAKLGVVANISVGLDPTGVAVDPGTGRVFVANNGSGNVSVINATSHAVVASLPAGTGPVGVAIAEPSGLAFVSNFGSSNVTVINATPARVVATIPIVGPGIQPQGMAFDPGSDQVWIGAGYFYAVVLNVTSLSVGGYVATDPSGVAYDSTNGEVCGTNTGNMSLFCVTSATSPSTLQFTATGLPAGTPWTVTLANGSARSNASQIDFGVVPGLFGYGSVSTSFEVTTPGPYFATPAGGTVSISPQQSSVEVNVTFSSTAGYYPVTFTESGLPGGTDWGVTLNGSVQHTPTASLSFYERNATGLAFQVLAPPGDRAAPSRGAVTVDGGPVAVSINFSLPTYPLEFRAGGFPSNSTSWYVWVNNDLVSFEGPVGELFVPNGTYNFSVLRAGPYVPDPSSGTVGVSGGGVVVPIEFALAGPPEYPVTFVESGLPNSTLWGIELGTGLFTTLQGSLQIALANGTDSYTVVPILNFTSSPTQGTLTVDGGPKSLAVRFTPTPSAALSVAIQQMPVSTSCLAGEWVWSFALSAQASGGAAPYEFNWSLPTGTADGPLAVTTLEAGASTAPGSALPSATVRVTVVDANGHSAVNQVLVAAGAPPICPSTSAISGGTPIWVWTAMVAAVGVALGTSLAAVWIARRRSR